MRPLSSPAAFVAYGVLAVVATWPLALRSRDHVFGAATPPLNVWALGFVLHQLPRAPLDLFEGNAFHPYPRSLAFSEHLLVPALIASPVVLLTGNLVLAHNLVALLTLALAALGMYRLALHLTGDPAAAFVAGLIYAFNTWNLNELIRLQVLSNQWFPFLLLALLRYFDAPGPRRAAAVGAFALLQALSCMYWALYLPLLLAPAVLFLALRARVAWRSLLPLAASLVGAALLVGLFFIPYLRNARELRHAREDPRPVGLGLYLKVRPGNLLYEKLLGTARANEGAAHFVGFAALALAVAGATARRPEGDRLRRLRPLLIALVVAGLLLSLGVRIRVGNRTLGPGPYALLRRIVPGFGLVRYPERFSLFLVLGLAPLAAAGVQRLRPRIGAAGIACLGALVFVEHLAIPLPLEPLPPASRLPEVYRSLASDPRVSVVAEVPSSRYHAEREDAWPMYASTAHWKRTLQGFTGYFPPSYNFTRWRLFHFPDPESLRFLANLGVDSVVVHPGPGGGPPPWAAQGAGFDVVRFDDGYRLLRLENPPRGFEAPAPDPRLLELDRSGWKVQASWPGAERAIDGDNATTWTTGEAQGKGDFFKVTLPRAVVLGRISIDVRTPAEFPMRLKVLGEDDQGWRQIPYDERRAYDGLFVSLLRRPADPRLDIDLPGPTLKAIRLRITETDAYWMPWTMADLRLYERRQPR